MEQLSRQTNNWDVNELEQLRSVARIGWMAYLQLYAELTTVSSGSK